MSALAARIRKAREHKVVVGKHTFFYRRPTDVEFQRLVLDRANEAAIAQEFVFGWENVTGIDMGGDTDDPVAFDDDDWREWCADSPKLWKPISDAVLAAYKAHVKALKEAEKKS